MELIFEWDKNKASANLRKHKVSFDEAKTIFADESLVTFPDEVHSDNEERFISIGTSANSRILLLVHTENDFVENKIVIRIISCRKATNLEREIYEQ
jgi:uncharacterized protein